MHCSGSVSIWAGHEVCELVAGADPISEISGMADANQLASPLGPLIRYGMVRARRDGRSLSLTSGYRSYAEQVAVRRANCGGLSESQIYDAPATACDPPTARPGTSKHQTGEAADMGGSKEWLAGLLAPYGVTRPVAGEDWHFEWRGGDRAATLDKLAQAMRVERFTAAELAEVGYVGGQWAAAPVLSAGTPGAASGGSVLSSLPGAGALGSVADVAGNLIDPAWWRRVLVGVGGVLLIGVGLVLLGRDLFKATPAAALSKALTQ